MPEIEKFFTVPMRATRCGVCAAAFCGRIRHAGRRSNFIARALLGVCAAAAGGPAASAAAAAPAAQRRRPPSPCPPSPRRPPRPPRLAPMSGAEVIEILDRTVDWYRTLGDPATIRHRAERSADPLRESPDRESGHGPRLRGGPRRPPSSARRGAPRRRRRDESNASGASMARVQRQDRRAGACVQGEIDTTAATARRRASKDGAALKAKLSELQGELDLVNTKKGIVAEHRAAAERHRLRRTPGALRAQIDAMAVALPSMADPAATAPRRGARTRAGLRRAHAPAAATPSRCDLSPPRGRVSDIWDVAAAVFKLSEKMNAIDRGIDRRTAALQDSYGRIRAQDRRADARAVGARRCAHGPGRCRGQPGARRPARPARCPGGRIQAGLGASSFP